MPQHIAYIYVYTLRVLPTRRWALICSVIKDLSLIFLGGQTSCDFWCRKQQAAQKRVRGDVVEEKIRKKYEHFCKTESWCGCKPTQRRPGGLKWWIWHSWHSSEPALCTKCTSRQSVSFCARKITPRAEYQQNSEFPSIFWLWLSLRRTC